MPAVITSAGEIDFPEPVFREILRILPDVAARKLYTLDARDIGGVTLDVGGPGVSYSTIRLQWGDTAVTLSDAHVAQMLERHAGAVPAPAVAPPQPAPPPATPAPVETTTGYAMAPAGPPSTSVPLQSYSPLVTSSTQAAAASATAAMPSAEWFLDVDGKSRGPFTMDEIISFVREGRTRPDQLVWRKGEDAWSALKTHPLFVNRLAAPAAAAAGTGLATDAARAQAAELVELLRSHVRSVNKYVTAEEQAVFEKWLGRYIDQGAAPTVEAAIGEILSSHDTPLFMKSRLIQSVARLALPNLVTIVRTAVKDKALRQYLQDKKLRGIVKALIG